MELSNLYRRHKGPPCSKLKNNLCTYNGGRTYQQVNLTVDTTYFFSNYRQINQWKINKKYSLTYFWGPKCLVQGELHNWITSGSGMNFIKNGSIESLVYCRCVSFVVQPTPLLLAPLGILFDKISTSNYLQIVFIFGVGSKHPLVNIFYLLTYWLNCLSPPKNKNYL